MRNGSKKFSSGKGLYLALALCLVGAGTAAWFAVDKTVKSVKPAPITDSPKTQEEEITEPPTEPVRENLDDILKDIPSSQPQTPPKEPEPEIAPEPVKEPEPAPAEPKVSSASSVPEKPAEKFSITLPVSGSALTPFSGSTLVKNETLNEWRTHNGIDLGAPKGTPVNSACEGVVSDVRSDPMWGNVVEVTSGEYTLVYAGLDQVTAMPEDHLSSGDQIGVIGSVPCELSMEPHLHFDVKQNGKYIDPVSLAK